MVSRNYEIILVASANLTDEESQELFAKFKKIITDSEGCSVQFENSWGRRKLAYEIDRQKNGIYQLYYATANGAVIEELERQCGYDENMLKTFVVTVSDLEKANQEFDALKADPFKTANLVSEVIGA